MPALAQTLSRVSGSIKEIPSTFRFMGLAILLWVSFFSCHVVQSQQPKTPLEKPIPTSTMEKFPGFFSFYRDKTTGKIWLEIEQFDSPFLYVTSLASGLGSNPVGLDRGQLGATRLVEFHRVGPEIFLEQQNLKYRASSENPAEKKAVRDSFAASILWSGTAKTADHGKVVVDITPLLVRDAHDCIGKLSRTGQGTFAFDRKRSFVNEQGTRGFPNNCEFDITSTFHSQSPGSLVRSVSATGHSITLRQHHSLVRLPDDQYRPRRFHPSSGCFSIGFQDYAAEIDEPLEKRWITRHRLKKKDPGAAISEAVKPIVYYVDPGTPPLIQKALIEGASWWNEAFEALGYKDAFQVRVLPVDADPMDIRFNVIQWVHRATRGWSIGQSVVDPRTGEIIKGHVLLGSLRVRQDELLVRGLTAETNFQPNSESDNALCGCCCRSENSQHVGLASVLSRDSQFEVALSRIRQLSAHEVGHTLGFAHNFAASTYGDRASVMDYPAPRAKIKGDTIDLSDAYGVGIGKWDRFTVQYAYSDFGPAANGEDQDVEFQKLKKMIAAAVADKMLYITDPDARPVGAAHPLASLWDNGSDPVAALAHEMKVRKIAMHQFHPNLISIGEPMSDLERLFVPIYLHHRYQVAATAKMLGGYFYSYATRGDGQVPIRRVPTVRQKEAFDELIKTLKPESLLIPEKVIQMLPPKPFASVFDLERFPSRAAPLFDPTEVMGVAAEITLSNLLEPHRATRMTFIKDESWGWDPMLTQLIEEIFNQPIADDVEHRRAARVVQNALVERFIRLAADPRASSDVVAIVEHKLNSLKLPLSVNEASQPAVEKSHRSSLVKKIGRFQRRPAPTQSSTPLSPAPPGSPIGDGNQ